MRQGATIGRADIQPDESGYLYHSTMRRAVAQMAGGASVDVLEALGALRLAAKQIKDGMERFAEAQGLSESRLRVLMRLHERTSRQMQLGELADLLNVTPRTITDIVDILERDDLVKRVPDPEDRRSILAVLTEAGLSRVNAIGRDAVSRQAAVARGFTPEQLVQLRHLCLLLVRNLNEEGGC